MTGIWQGAPSTQSGSLGGSALLAFQTATITVSVPGARAGNAVVVAPNTFPGAGVIWFGYVSANDVVTVVITALIALTPAASTYNVWVLQ
jgi:hypothetical protein